MLSDECEDRLFDDGVCVCLCLCWVVVWMAGVCGTMGTELQ